MYICLDTKERRYSNLELISKSKLNNIIISKY